MNKSGFEEQIVTIDIMDSEKAKQIYVLQKQSYRVEAELIGSDKIPPLMESLEELMTSGEMFLGYYESREIVGALSYKRDGKLIDIHRMMVHPSHFRKGIAKHLLKHLEKNETGVHELTVSTGSANKPAINLYEKLGYKKVRETVVAEGLSLTQLLKTIG